MRSQVTMIWQMHRNKEWLTQRCDTNTSIHRFYFSVSVSPPQICIFLLLPVQKVTAPDCLIPSRGIGDIRTNPVPSLPESQPPGISRDEEQWDSTDQSVRRSDRTGRRQTVDELVGANTFSQSVGDPDIEQVKTHDRGFLFLRLSSGFTSKWNTIFLFI